MTQETPSPHPLHVVGLDLSLRGTACVEVLPDGRPGRSQWWSDKRGDLTKFGGGVGAQRAVLSSPVAKGDTLGSWRRTVAVSEGVVAWCTSTAHDVGEGCSLYTVPALVVVEDHAFAATSTSAYRMGHLHGIVRHGLTSQGFGVLMIEPTVLKAFATGKGGADKDAMVDAAARAGHFLVRELHADTANNVADAYWLARLGQTWQLLRAGRLRLEQLAPTVRRVFDHGLLDRPLLTA